MAKRCARAVRLAPALVCALACSSGSGSGGGPQGGAAGTTSTAGAPSATGGRSTGTGGGTSGTGGTTTGGTGGKTTGGTGGTGGKTTGGTGGATTGGTGGTTTGGTGGKTTGGTGGASGGTGGTTGGTGGTTTGGTGGTGGTLKTYTTNFPLTENPISEGGRWLNGKADGLDWGDVSTTPGETHPHPGAARYADATALLKGTWAPNQMAQGTVWTGNPSNYPEVELRLRSSLSAHVCNGYEITFSIAPNSYLLIVRWNGPLANYTILTQPTGSQYQVKTGDVVKATIVGNVITAYKNGQVMATATDSTYTSGQPGMGFNEQQNGDYGYSSYTASELP